MHMKKIINHYLHPFMAIVLSSMCLSPIYSLILPIKRLVKIGSMRENQLTGYGLVVGLPQTGDTRNILTTEMLKNTLSSRGMKIDDSKLKTKNVAIVMVMAKIPPIALPGNFIDIWVSSVGNAKSLKNGYLLQTPLSGADGKIYAVAQGSVVSSSSLGKSKTQRVNVRSTQETTTFISNGAIIEKKITQPLISVKNNRQIVIFNLIYFDISTANNIINGINKSFINSTRLNKDGTIIVQIPETENSIKFISNILEIPVKVESKAKVVIDPRSGTIVMGGNVGLSPIAVSKSGMNIKIGNSQDNLDEKNKNKKSTISFLEEAPTISQLVNILNKLGVDAHEMIDILKAIHSAGALHAELLII